MGNIERFEVRGLAGRPETIGQVLDRNTNIFWGLNGCGKTSLLKILSSALSNDTILLNDVEFEYAEIVFWDNRRDRQYKRTIHKRRNEPQSIIDFDFHSSEETQGEELLPEVEELIRLDRLEVLSRTRMQEFREIQGQWKTEVLNSAARPERHSRDEGRFPHVYLPVYRFNISRSSFGSRSLLREGIEESVLDEIFSARIERRWRDFNSRASARIRRIQEEGMAKILAILVSGTRDQSSLESLTNLPASEAFELVTGFLTQQRIMLPIRLDEFESNYDRQPSLQHVVSEIQKVTQQSEDILRPLHEFQAVVSKLYSGNKYLEVDSRPRTHPGGSLKVKSGDVPLKLERLSSGEKQMLHLMLEVLVAGKSSVMIDEPELSMHVDWQQKLVESMRRVNPECQLIFATHSPEIMAEVPEEYIFEL